MPKNISAETTQTALFFSRVSKAQPQACALQEGVCLLERIQVRNKNVDSLVHIRSARLFWGKIQLEAGGVKRYVKQKNDGAETFSPGDFLRHGGHEGSGYSAV